jgi:acetylornithine deacetylase/succinyl-diaminopimelate desuccinylase-like protein
MPSLSSAPTANPDVARVHGALARARARLVARDAVTVRDQVTLAEIPAPTGEEVERGDWVARRFRALGLADVRVDAAGNVVGRRPGEDRSDDAPRVAVCAHLDTVFPRETPLRVRHEGRRLVGPGIGDNGRGLAAMLALAETFDGAQLRTRHAIEFVATTGEEGLGDLRGAKRYFAETPARGRRRPRRHAPGRGRRAAAPARASGDPRAAAAEEAEPRLIHNARGDPPCAYCWSKTM